MMAMMTATTMAKKLNMNTKMDMMKVEMTTMTGTVEMDGRKYMTIMSQRSKLQALTN